MHTSHEGGVVELGLEVKGDPEAENRKADKSPSNDHKQLYPLSWNSVVES
jgi:hypothetical protein